MYKAFHLCQTLCVLGDVAITDDCGTKLQYLVEWFCYWDSREAKFLHQNLRDNMVLSHSCAVPIALNATENYVILLQKNAHLLFSHESVCINHFI